MPMTPPPLRRRSAPAVAGPGEHLQADAVLTGEGDVHDHVRGICFKTGPPGTVGAELEWLVVDPTHPARAVALPRLQRLLAGPMPGGSLVTFEPAGQVELSSRPAPDVTTCVADLQRDVAHLLAVLASDGLTVVPAATDPHPRRPRQLDRPRYAAMEAYFDALGHDLGRTMMRSTTAVQVSLDAGADEADVAARWRLLHTVGPTLVAAFANSPRLGGRATGAVSTRQRVWRGLDPARTHAPTPNGDPAAAYAEFVLDAPLMFTGEDCRPHPGGTLRDWVSGRLPHLDPPTTADLQRHLTTLFPPVRARGWFEVRYLDALPPQWWPVPVTILATLLERPRAAAAAEHACAPVADTWDRAAHLGPRDDALARAAGALFDAVEAELPAVTGDPALVRLVADYRQTYVDRRRCPADDPAFHDSALVHGPDATTPDRQETA